MIAGLPRVSSYVVLDYLGKVLESFVLSTEEVLGYYELDLCVVYFSGATT